MRTQVILSVVEVLALVGVLLFFLRRIDTLLAHIQGNLGKIGSSRKPVIPSRRNWSSG